MDFWISLMKLLNPLWWVFVNQIPLSTDSEWMLWDLWQRMCWWLEILSQKMLFPAKAVGCRVAWLKGEGWGGEVIDESVPDVIITNLAQLPVLL